MDDMQLKQLINTPPVTRSIRVGDIVVRVAVQRSIPPMVPIGAVGRVIEKHTAFRMEVETFQAHSTVYSPITNWQHASPAQIAEFEERERRERP